MVVGLQKVGNHFLSLRKSSKYMRTVNRHQALVRKPRRHTQHATHTIFFTLRLIPRSGSPLSRPHQHPACATCIRYLFEPLVSNMAWSRMALPPGPSSSTGLGTGAGAEALGEGTHPRCSLPLIVWGHGVLVVRNWDLVHQDGLTTDR